MEVIHLGSFLQSCSTLNWEDVFSSNTALHSFSPAMNKTIYRIIALRVQKCHAFLPLMLIVWYILQFVNKELKDEVIAQLIYWVKFILKHCTWINVYSFLILLCVKFHTNNLGNVCTEYFPSFRHFVFNPPAIPYYLLIDTNWAGVTKENHLFASTLPLA